jgi:aerobic-type carbon monoxide dehydrogenase small subunit (CoxS/CutS family)
MPDLRVIPDNDIAGVDRGVPFEFFFEGEPVKAYYGESVGAALLAARIVTFRSTRQNGRPRGIFCGIGICFDCLVVVDGRPNVRACVTLAAPGMRVNTQSGSAGDVYGLAD